MGIDNAHYHGWHGALHSPWWGCVAIVRVALLQVFRRKSYWVVLGLGLLNFLLFWAIIYAVTQFEIPRRSQEMLLHNFGFSPNPTDAGENGYIWFMQRQSIVVMILLAFSGSLLIGADFRFNSMPFYLSRRIDRRHYIAGKLLAIATVVLLITVVPALLLFIEYGLFTSSLDYWRVNWRIPLSVITYGLSLCVVLSILLVTLSAYLQRMAPIAITWSSLFVMLATMSDQLKEATGHKAWNLLDPWHDMRYLGKLCFGSFRNSDEVTLAWWACAILAAVCGLSLIALVRRVRAVDVVT
jgi:ABC-type transport system involved in multi-copper enzyme maturation permease subunit